MDSNKRQGARPRAHKILVRISSAEKLRAHYLRDLSEGALFIRAEKTLPLDSDVEIELYPPGWEQPLVLRGRVVRVATDEAARKANQAGMAIHFQDVPDDTTERLNGLIREYGEAAAPAAAAPEESELEHLKAQVQGLTLELGAAKEALQSHEREQQSLRQKLQSSQANLAEALRDRDLLAEKHQSLEGEVDKLRQQASGPSAADEERLSAARTEVADLRTRLAEAEGKIEAYEHEIKTLEEDDAATRSLAEVLAREKAQLEKARKQEQEKLSSQVDQARREAEQARLALMQELEFARRRADEAERTLELERGARGELENALLLEKKQRLSAESKVEAAQRAADEANAQLMVLRNREQDSRKGREELEAERTRSAGLERQLQDARTQLDRARARERDLRRLMNLISSKQSDEVVLVEETTEDDDSVTVEEPEPGADEPLTGSTADEPEPSAQEAAPEPPLAPPPVAPLLPPEPAKPADDVDVPLDLDFMTFDEPLGPEKTPARVSSPPAGASRFEDSDLPSVRSPTDDNLPSPAGTGNSGGPSIGDVDEFQRQLRRGSRLLRTDRFHRHTPTDRAEILVSSWLENVDSWQVLSTLAMGRMSEESLARTLFQFYRQGLVDVR